MGLSRVLHWGPLVAIGGSDKLPDQLHTKLRGTKECRKRQHCPTIKFVLGGQFKDFELFSE